MLSVRRTTAVAAAGALSTGIVISGLGMGAAGAATYPPNTPTPTVTVTQTPTQSPTPTTTPANPGKIKCKARAVQGKDRIRVSLKVTGDAANFKNFTFKIQKYLKRQDAWKINNIAYNITPGTPRVVDRERGIYRAKCLGPDNRAPLTNRVTLNT